MSEQSQHTAEQLRERMMSRYGDVHHHKHDKRHLPYRLHCRSHPRLSGMKLLQHQKINGLQGEDLTTDFQKSRKRLIRHMIH